jgi:hypothetical protein
MAEIRTVSARRFHDQSLLECTVISDGLSEADQAPRSVYGFICSVVFSFVPYCMVLVFYVLPFVVCRHDSRLSHGLSIRSSVK